ncbi:TIR domain-containing protein [Paenibacillus oenotherae]|uniref:TIR domain-containing protein n=1 Tax=Paenibacillus oenotherae TaxID=1435645 RepID=A0ABS7D2A3_9BACL|nr:RNA-binding domain-containing protein [Paenibacillus oenotherae]MBW7473983.1 TIR domain-containing protein [Paenibacillus oenotherae]
MKLNEKDIIDIISKSKLDNLICKPLESRPGELAKFICGLANNEGGYILIGVEKDNGILKPVGLQLAFDMSSIMESTYKKLTGDAYSVHQYVSVAGINIFAIKVKKSKRKIMVDGTYYCYKNNGVEIIGAKVSNEPPTLFISYTECDTPIVDIIEKGIREKLKNEVEVSRYTELRYKDSFMAFMNTLQDHDYVLIIISDTYLKRQACMYEVGETLKDHHYKNKLLFVVLSENERRYYGKNAPEKIGTSIYDGAQAKLEYIGFWKDKHDNLRETMNKIGDYEATREAAKDLQIMGQIYRKDMGELLQFLSDENGKSFEKLYENEFTDIVEWIV